MPEVDATDARLLLALAEDPRASVMALSQRLGLARNTVQARLARLESNDVLAPLDRRIRPEALGYRLGAYVTVTVVQRSLAEVSDALAAHPRGHRGHRAVRASPTCWSRSWPGRRRPVADHRAGAGHPRRAAHRHRARAAPLRRPPARPAARAGRRRGSLTATCCPGSGKRQPAAPCGRRPVPAGTGTSGTWTAGRTGRRSARPGTLCSHSGGDRERTLVPRGRSRCVCVASSRGSPPTTSGQRLRRQARES